MRLMVLLTALLVAGCHDKGGGGGTAPPADTAIPEAPPGAVGADYPAASATTVKPRPIPPKIPNKKYPSPPPHQQGQGGGGTAL